MGARGMLGDLRPGFIFARPSVPPFVVHQYRAE
jgi:hypothetical protein